MDGGASPVGSDEQTVARRVLKATRPKGAPPPRPPLIRFGPTSAVLGGLTLLATGAGGVWLAIDQGSADAYYAASAEGPAEMLTSPALGLELQDLTTLSPQLAETGAEQVLVAGELRLRPLSREDALTASGGASDIGLLVLNAVAAEATEMQRGDVVVGLCGQAGVLPADRLANALSERKSSCALVIRDGAIVQVSLAPAGDPNYRQAGDVIQAHP